MYKLYELEDDDDNDDEDDKIIHNINQVFTNDSGVENTTIEDTVSSSSDTLCDEVGIASSNEEAMIMKYNVICWFYTVNHIIINLIYRLLIQHIRVIGMIQANVF